MHSSASGTTSRMDRRSCSEHAALGFVEPGEVVIDFGCRHTPSMPGPYAGASVRVAVEATERLTAARAQSLITGGALGRRAKMLAMWARERRQNVRYVAPSQLRNFALARVNPQVLTIARHYLRWTEDATGQLGNLLAADAVTEIVQTQAYWQLRAATGAEPRFRSRAITTSRPGPAAPRVLHREPVHVGVPVEGHRAVLHAQGGRDGEPQRGLVLPASHPAGAADQESCRVLEGGPHPGGFCAVSSA